MKVFGEQRSVRFTLKGIDHPFYFWPRTLLDYPVRFEGARVKPGELSLVRLDTGQGVPFQLSQVKEQDGALQFAVVSFFSDLPTGAERTFERRAGAPPAPVVSEPAVKESREGTTITLDTGALKLRIPASQKAGAQAPGLILQMCRGGAWLGESRLISPKRRVVRLTTTRTEAGPLFRSYRVAYEMEGNARYTVTLRCVSGMDWVPRFESDVKSVPALMPSSTPSTRWRASGRTSSRSSWS